MTITEQEKLINSAKGIVFSFYAKNKWRRAFIAQADTNVGMTIHDLDNPKPNNKNYLYCWQFSRTKGASVLLTDNKMYATIQKRAALFLQLVIANDYKLSKIEYSRLADKIHNRIGSGSGGCPFA